LPTDILQEVGSYAGLAAIIGLAVLSALYFSQARDVKRLREWAGRAPERSAEDVAQTAAAPASSGAVVAQPQAKKAAGAPAPAGAGAQPGQAKPGAPKPAGAPGVPVPAQAAAAGAAPATARAAGGPEGSAPAAATPAGEAKQAVAGEGPRAPGEQAEAGATAAATTDTDESAAAKPGEEPAVAATGAAQDARDGESDQLDGDEAAEREEAVAAHGAQSAAARRQEGAAAPAARPGDTEDQEALVPPQAAPVPQAAAAGAGTQTPEGLRPGGRAGTQAPPRPRPATGSRPTPSPQAGRAPSVPGRAGSRPPARPGSARAGQTAIIPPPSRAPWYGRLAARPRYLVLVIAGLLIVGGGALFGLSQLGEDDAGTGSRSAGAGGGSAEQADDGGGGQAARQPIVPAQVTVAVLNGTTVPGLAAQIGDRIETFGFDLGTVTNSTDQQRAESVVLFAPGHQREAVAVGRRLSIDQRERVDAESQGLAGDATVVVIAGIDQTQ
jgi:hypothetical protein